MLVEVLRLKVGQFRAEKKPFKVILGTYLDYATELQKDIKNKFFIKYMFEELGVQVVTMEDLQKGLK